MKTFFILCTAVTVLQIFDVFITDVSAATNENKPNTPTQRKVLKPQPTPSNNKPDNDNIGKNPNDVDSGETGTPTTFIDSGKRVVKTMQKISSRRGVGVMNGFSGFLKKSDGAFNVFGNFLRERANNLNEVAEESLGLVSGFGDSSTRGAKNLIKSSRTIGAEGAKELDSNLQKLTKLGVNAIQLGGTAVGAPISLGGNALAATNWVVKAPSKISKKVTNRFFGRNINEEEDQDGDRNKKGV